MAAVACSAFDDGPEKALAVFLTDIERGRFDEAWAALSEESRRSLEAKHEALAQARQADQAYTPTDILSRELRLRVKNPHDSIVVVGPLGDRVRLRVTIPGGQHAEVWMVREQKRWKVDLVGSLAEAEPEPLGQADAVEPYDPLADLAEISASTATPSSTSTRTAP